MLSELTYDIASTINAMSYIAVLVESPAKCASIEKYLGSGYKCMATFGHIRSLEHLNHVDIANNFKPTFSEVAAKAVQISKLRAFINGASEVLIASDDDREGEAIAWHICDMFGLPIDTTKRIVFHEITKPALERAVITPTRVNTQLVMAQQARQILDLLVGFKISPVLWNKVSYKTKTGLSAGRCQTPALKIIYENQKEIEASPGRKVYNTTGYFTQLNLPFQLEHNHDNEDDMYNFLEESASHEHKYECGNIRKTTKNQPLPYTTSTLQQAASNELHLSPKATMEACQKLYEAGLITYMRTDSTTYSAEFLGTARTHITSNYGSEYVRADLDTLSEGANKGANKGAEVSTAQEAHEAIRPTQIERTVAGEDVGSREARVYALIWRNTVESCMAHAKYDAVTAIISAPNDYLYKYLTEQVVFPGWKAVVGVEVHNEAYHMLLALKNQVLQYKKITSKVTMKDTKSHLTEARLVQMLEQHGIGRPSTFSSLVDKVQERGYVKKDNIQGKKIECIDYELQGEVLNEVKTSRDFGGEKGKLVIQPIGVLVIEFLIEHFGTIFEYDYTKSMEDTLDAIAKGEFVWHELCRDCFNEIDKLITNVQFVDRQTIIIDNEHTYMVAKYGPVIKCTKGDKITFLKVREDIDIERLRSGGYTLSDLVITKTASKSGRELGKIGNNIITLHTGKYGNYVQYGDKKITIDVEKEYCDISLNDVKQLLSSVPEVPQMRKLSGDASIRNGKFGHYIYYKTSRMKTPRFLHLKGFHLDYFQCPISAIVSWVEKTHKLRL